MPREVTFVTPDFFEKDRKRVLNDDGIMSVREKLALRPELGEMIPRTGGARKIRQMGTSGDARVIYYYHKGTAQVFFLGCYAKNSKGDLTARELNELAEITKDIKQALTGEGK